MIISNEAATALYEACESMMDTCGSPENWNGETYKSLILIRDAMEMAENSEIRKGNAVIQAEIANAKGRGE